MTEQPRTPTTADASTKPARSGKSSAGKTAGAAAGAPDAERAGAGTTPPKRARFAVPLELIFAVVALGWLGVMLRSAQVSVTTAAEGTVAVYLAAYSLPGLISASLVAGAATGLTAVTMIGPVRRAGATVRFAVAAVGGLLVGAVAALIVLNSYGQGGAITILAATFAASATAGGAFAGIRHAALAGAVVNASLGVFLIGFVLNLFQDPLLNLFGAGDTQSSQATALSWFSLTSSLLSALIAGLVAYLTLTSRQGDERPKWVVYLAGGAGAGMVLLVSEAIARTGGGRLLDLAGRLSEADQAAQEILANSRFNNGLIVLFIGAITAMILLGRTLKPIEDD
ncbi:hypothetical protein [Catenuloplanes indicus]|uniref:Uncharacterized protein n=1 Tax=Catenuloplanes indicus TaxID=137267 RepID=A0AAE4AX69_9ACTN|nr:hypothetical protein [Catenuloplanes indicus]MDQ0366720.1 hypothetical protein [Catenuloplanes indicus]